MRILATFSYAYIQVALICLNTWQIANSKVAGSIIVGFLISLVWCFNTQRAALYSFSDKMVYSTGACLGTVTGILLSGFIY